MKNWMRRVGLATLVLGVFGAAMLSCSSVRNVSGVRFLEVTKQIEVLGTTQGVTYIGTTGSRVYLEKWDSLTVFEPEYTVYCTELSELPDEIAVALRAGRNPWKRTVPNSQEK
jgi:hypothetical protein